MMRERFLTGSEARGEPNHGLRTNVEQWPYSLLWNSQTFFVSTKLNVAAQDKTLSLISLITCRLEQITSKTTHQRDRLINFNTHL